MLIAEPLPHIQWRETWDKHFQRQHKKYHQETMNVPHIPKSLSGENNHENILCVFVERLRKGTK
jgi:hypothetical protein